MGRDSAENQGHTDRNSEQNPGQTEESSENPFTEDEDRRCQIRYAENCDVYDPVYLKWLEVNHPESLPMASILEHFA